MSVAMVTVLMFIRKLAGAHVGLITPVSLYVLDS